jgi:hypothetical protein
MPDRGRAGGAIGGTSPSGRVAVKGRSPPELGCCSVLAAMTVTRQEDQFPSPCLSGRRRLGEATFAPMGGKEEDAPVADLGRLSEKLKTRAKKLRLAPRRRSSMRAA